MPKGITVYIRDAMTDVKYKPPTITTTQEYMSKHVLGKVKRVMNAPDLSITHYFMLLDKGAPIAKKLFAHKKRQRKGVTPLPEPTTFPHVLPSDGMFSVNWDSLLANRKITRREVYPMFYRAVMEMYDPNEGQWLIIDGAPAQQMSKGDFESTPDAFDHVYFTHKAPKEHSAPVMSSRDILNTPMPGAPRIVRGVEPAYSHNIMEADMSAFYYVNKQLTAQRAPGQRPPDILIDSNDGDSVLIALLHARDRINPQDGKFRQRLWVKLKGQRRTREAYAARKKKAIDAGKEWTEDPIDGRDVYININKLYHLIDRDKDLVKAQNPVLTCVALFIFGGTDFFDGYHEDDHALFFNMGGKGWEKYIFNTWCKHADRFSHMIMLFYAGESLHGQPDTIRTPHIDENAILMFIYQCYAARYGAAVRKVNKGKCTINMLRGFCESFRTNLVKKEGEEDDKWNRRYLMAKKKRIPPQYVLRRYVRLMLLNVRYWINDYRPGGPESLNPLEKHEGLPYYGFMEREGRSGWYTLSPMCSAPKTPPTYYTRFFGKYRTNGAEEDDGSREEEAASRVLTEKRKRETEKAKRKVERDQRRKQLKIKRERVEALRTEGPVSSKSGNGSAAALATPGMLSRQRKKKRKKRLLPDSAGGLPRPIKVKKEKEET